MKRHGMVIGIRDEKIAEYKRLHAAVWPDVLEVIKECNLNNYSIYLKRLDAVSYTHLTLPTIYSV